MNAKNVEVSDSRFRAVHGKAPRGVGGWAFVMQDGSVWWATPHKRFSTAKRQAKAEAARQGFWSCQVAP